ncbi:winged helix-turn-helix domain-containing protein [uncultured Allofournierella sp.]|uniref:winged helix-turn-helix domain-containing protein n=1 Tax=uncultured Allofournierella sp. TaxID=1940258 RepID=UPI00374FE6D5
MKPHIFLQLCDDQNQRFFGSGPYRLLLGVEELGSLRASAQRMGMAYSKALALIRTAEQELGFPLTCRTIGGKGGGGSTLTEGARELMMRYEAYVAACSQACDNLFQIHFGSFDASRYSSQTCPPQQAQP